MEVPVFLGGTKWQVGFAKANGQKEGFLFGGILVQCLEGILAHYSINVAVIRHLGRFSTRALEPLALEIFWGGVTHGGFTHKIMQRWDRPGGRILGRLAAAMEYLANGTGMIAVILEMLGQGDGLGSGLTEMGGQIPHLDGVRPQAG